MDGFINILQRDRIDLFAAIVYFPVPADEFEATERRIRREMLILEAAGEDPNSVSADVADRIISEAAGEDPNSVSADAADRILSEESLETRRIKRWLSRTT